MNPPMDHWTHNYLRCFNLANRISGIFYNRHYPFLLYSAVCSDHDDQMQGPGNLLDLRYRPPGWVVIEATEQGVVMSDPELSLIGAGISGWRLLLTAALDAALVAFLFLVAPPLWILWVLGCFAALMIPLCLLCIWGRWRTPCHVRIGRGRMFLRCRKGSKLSEYDWEVGEIVELETAFNNSKFHSNYAFRVHTRDGSRVPFLHCVNGLEAHWLLNYMKMLVANEQGALMVQEGLAPALEFSLPPPPLPAMAARVAAIEGHVLVTAPADVLRTAPAPVLRTAPPGLPDSQNASISNQNKA